MAFLGKVVIANNSCSLIASHDLYYFGILMSSMHMAWVRSVCGRIKSDFRYSNNLVYNNFPWPEDVDNRQRKIVRAASEEILACRKRYPDSSLADMYDPLSMPKDLLDAHKKLDEIVEKMYGVRKKGSDLEKLLLLFRLYSKYTGDVEQTTLFDQALTD